MLTEAQENAWNDLEINEEQQEVERLQEIEREQTARILQNCGSLYSGPILYSPLLGLSLYRLFPCGRWQHYVTVITYETLPPSVTDWLSLDIAMKFIEDIAESRVC